jgi:hypothetical protein
VIAANVATASNAGGAWNSGAMTLRRCLIIRNIAHLNGGGLYNRRGTLTLIESTVRSNSATMFDGGGIANNLGTVVLNDSTVNENTAPNNDSGDGGGIGNDSSLIVNNSTFNFNTTYGDGGGIWNAGSLTIVNSTISRNVSVDNTGGGIYNRGDLADLNNVTVTDNKARISGGGINNAAGTLNFKNTIVALNFLLPLVLNDCAGTLNSQGYNLIRVVNCVIAGDATGNIIGFDPLLGPLADNGGPTETHALLPVSPAINAANPDIAGDHACAATDQRGLTRPQGLRCDIGAYEFEAAEANGVYLPLVVKWPE